MGTVKSGENPITDRWTEARFRSFHHLSTATALTVNGALSTMLRSGSYGLARGIYKCARCARNKAPQLPCRHWKESKRKRNNAAVDHIDPVVDPAVGFIDWNTYIDRMFIEAEGYQVLCHKCHTAKTNAERKRRKK